MALMAGYDSSVLKLYRIACLHLQEVFYDGSGFTNAKASFSSMAGW